MFRRLLVNSLICMDLNRVFFIYHILPLFTRILVELYLRKIAFGPVKIRFSGKEKIVNFDKKKKISMEMICSPIEPDFSK